MTPKEQAYYNEELNKDQYSKIDECRTFENNNEKSQYIDLLQKEMATINKLNLGEKAKRLYSLKKDFPQNRISSRCLDFSLLEKYARTYVKNNF